MDKKWKKAGRALAYAPTPDRTLVALVTDEAYRSAYLRGAPHDGLDRYVPFVGGQWHHVCMAFEVGRIGMLRFQLVFLMKQLKSKQMAHFTNRDGWAKSGFWIDFL